MWFSAALSFCYIKQTENRTFRQTTKPGGGKNSTFKNFYILLQAARVPRRVHFRILLKLICAEECCACCLVWCALLPTFAKIKRKQNPFSTTACKYVELWKFSFFASSKKGIKTPHNLIPSARQELHFQLPTFIARNFLFQAFFL